jgi:RND superfamily putative drug exporter
MATMLVPSLTALLGRRAWWPGHRDRSGPRPGQEPQPEQEPAAPEKALAR